VPIQRENQTLASITFQNYFRMYGRLAGMTGTADTEAFEFQQIYHLETVVIPTNVEMIRKDENDLVFRTLQEKVDAIIGDIEDCHERGQPVLVGTTSIENSEMLAGHLEKRKLPHQVLNAKQHASEAEIIAQAGRPKMITIATNMAGRGTDIVLGGAVEPQVLKIREDEALSHTEKELQIGKLRADWKLRHDTVIAAGGLHIVGTERHESRRIDNQLRGRSGRQGDPGSSRFYLSLEDPLLRIFGGERLAGIMQRLKMPEGEPIEHPIVNRSIAKAQNRVESRNFDIRKQLLEYDDVANDQRRVIYQQRDELLEQDDISETIRNMVAGQVEDSVRVYVPPESVEEQWDIAALEATLAAEYKLQPHLGEWLKTEPELNEEAVRVRVRDLALKQYESKLALVDAELFHDFERRVMLQVVDQHWREHLAALDHLRGDPPSRLCAEEPEAGVQARGLRAVFGHARSHQARRGAVRAYGGSEHATGRQGGRRGAGALQRALPACGLRRGAGSGCRYPGGRRVSAAVHPFGTEGRAQRSLPLRLGQEVQALPRTDLTDAKLLRAPQALSCARSPLAVLSGTISRLAARLRVAHGALHSVKRVPYAG
jgi:preprotein translocase subunit SecA